MAPELTAARQAMMRTSYKLDVVLCQAGDIRKQVTGMRDQLRRMEIMLQKIVYSQRNTTEPALGRSTPEGNFKYPSTGFSVVATGWENPDEVCVKNDARFEDGTVVSKSEGVEFTIKEDLDCAVLEDFGIPSWLFELSLPTPDPIQEPALVNQWNLNLSKEKVLSAPTVNADLPSFINMKLEQTVVNAKSCTGDGHNVDRKLPKFCMQQLYSVGLLWNLPPWPDLSFGEVYWTAKGMDKGAGTVSKRNAYNVVAGQSKNQFQPTRNKQLTDFVKEWVAMVEQYKLKDNIARFFDSTLEHGADAKLAANWIMGNPAVYMINEKLSIDEIKSTPLKLFELIASIKNGTIRGKIGKESLDELIAKGGFQRTVANFSSDIRDSEVYACLLNVRAPECSAKPSPMSVKDILHRARLVLEHADRMGCKRYLTPIKLPFRKVEKCNQVLKIGKELKFSLVNIVGNDIVQGNKKLILAFLWQLMRYYILQLLNNLRLHLNRKEITDSDILMWANKKVKDFGNAMFMWHGNSSTFEHQQWAAEVAEFLKPGVAVKHCKEGVITIADGNTFYNELEVVEGIKLDRGYISPYYLTCPKTQKCESEDPLILMYDKKVSNFHAVVKVLELALKNHKPLLIVAEDVESEALDTLIINKLRAGIKVCTVKAPGFGENRKAYLQDLAILIGGEVITDEPGMNLENFEPQILDACKMVTVSKDDTVILDRAGDKKSIEEGAEQIKSAIEQSTSDYDKKRLQERLAKLSGGVAVLKIGGASEAEMIGEFGSKHMVYLPDMIPCLLDLWNDETPTVARQAVRTGTNLFATVLEQLVIQGLFSSGGIEDSLNLSWEWLLKLKSVVSLMAFQHSSNEGVRLLAVKFVKKTVLMYTPNPNIPSDLPSEATEDMGFNVAWLRGGHPLLNVGDLAMEASQSLGLSLEQLKSLKVKSLNTSMIIVFVSSLSAIGERRPSLNGRILPVLLYLDPASSIIKVQVPGAFHALKSAFTACLKCTHSSAEPWRACLLEAQNIINQGDSIEHNAHAARSFGDTSNRAESLLLAEVSTDDSNKRSLAQDMNNMLEDDGHSSKRVRQSHDAQEQSEEAKKRNVESASIDVSSSHLAHTRTGNFEAVDKVVVPDFQPKQGVKIETDEKATNLSSASVDDAAVIEDLLPKLETRSLPRNDRLVTQWGVKWENLLPKKHLGETQLVSKGPFLISTPIPLGLGSLKSKLEGKSAVEEGVMSDPAMSEALKIARISEGTEKKKRKS